jgi:uncharacterized protein YcaQ
MQSAPRQALLQHYSAEHVRAGWHDRVVPSNELSLAEARRIALAAQGLADPRPTGPADLRALNRVLRHTGLLQIDSVNVLVRAHYLPVFSRLGPYPMDLVDRAAAQRPRRLFEYWGHEASLLPVEMHPLLRWRMERARREAWGGIRRIADEQPDFVRWVKDEVAAHGPVTAGEIQHDAPPRAREDWGWNWSDVKRALEFLFWSGEVTVASRRGFERLYDLPERVLPPKVIATPTPSPAEAHRKLVRIAARCHGVATDQDLRDYFRTSLAETRTAIAELVDDGTLVPVRVESWRRAAYLYRGARLPRQAQARALLAPFDPVVWERTRTQALFGFRYRIEIYVPPPKRVHGYYVLPFLRGDRLVARVDLKADRQAGVLRVQAAYGEPSPPPVVPDELADELRLLAKWLDLSDITVAPRGDLAPALAAAVH